VTAACLAISYPTIVSAPHMLINGFKNLVAVAAETEIEFEEAITFKEYLKVMKLKRYIIDDNIKQKFNLISGSIQV